MELCRCRVGSSRSLLGKRKPQTPPGFFPRVDALIFQRIVFAGCGHSARPWLRCRPSLFNPFSAARWGDQSVSSARTVRDELDRDPNCVTCHASLKVLSSQH
jgi:hypothetical protein